MDVLKAKQIIFNNSQISENTFIYNLHEKGCYSEELFWEYYDSIATLVRNSDTKSSEVENQITDVYLKVLKYLVFHFDPADNYIISGIPKDYIGVIERLEYALIAYRNSSEKLLSEDLFEMKRQ
jgi:hypothetical protein